MVSHWWAVLAFFAGALFGYIASIATTERAIQRAQRAFQALEGPELEALRRKVNGDVKGSDWIPPKGWK